jgi:hypothetical protein
MRAKLIPIYALLIAAGCCVGAASPRTVASGTRAKGARSRVVKVTSNEAMKHRIAKPEPIRLQRGEYNVQYFVWIDLEIVVDETGNVSLAKAIGGPKEFYTRAIDIALLWKFQPFVRKGKPVGAEFTYGIGFLPPELLPLTRVPFPEIHDWNALRITLQRGGCVMGPSCPDYGVEIHGDGSFSYTGKAYVTTMGTVTGQISMDDMRELVDLFRAADYYSLQDEYIGAIGGPPTYTTSISIDGQSKKIEDEVGIVIGMPQAVKDIEDAIDRIAGTAKWIGEKSESDIDLMRGSLPSIRRATCGS